MSMKTYKFAPEDRRNQFFMSEADTTKSFLLQFQLALQIISTLGGRQTSEQKTRAHASVGGNAKRGKH